MLTYDAVSLCCPAVTQGCSALCGLHYVAPPIDLRLAIAGSKLVLAFTGMSVCAAHGNYYKESYAHVIGDSIREAFEGAGIEVVTRNQVPYCLSCHSLVLP